MYRIPAAPIVGVPKPGPGRFILKIGAEDIAIKFTRPVALYRQEDKAARHTEQHHAAFGNESEAAGSPQSGPTEPFLSGNVNAGKADEQDFTWVHPLRERLPYKELRNAAPIEISC